MSPSRSRRTSARFSYEDIENALCNAENVVSKTEIEDTESDGHFRNIADKVNVQVDSADEGGTASSASAEHVGRYG